MCRLKGEGRCKQFLLKRAFVKKFYLHSVSNFSLLDSFVKEFSRRY